MTDKTDTELLAEALDQELTEMEEDELYDRLEKVVLTGQDALDQMEHPSEGVDRDMVVSILDEMLGDDLLYLRRKKEEYEGKLREMRQAEQRMEDNR